MIRRFFSQAWLSFKAHTAAFQLDEFLLFETAYPLLTLIFYCVLAGYSFQTTELTHWVVGNSFLLCVNTCVFSLGGGFCAERYNGRIRSIMVAPSSKLAFILEQGFFQILIAAITVFIGFFAGSLIFGVDFTGINIGLLLLVIIIAMFSASGFGLMLSSLGLLTDGMHLVLNLASYVLMIFCGANFPVSQLPRAGQVISRLLPLTRSIEAADMLFEAMPNMPFFTWLLIGEILIGVIFFLVAFAVVKSAERIAIRRASLELF